MNKKKSEINDAKLYRFLRPLISFFTKIVFRPNYIGLENVPSDKAIILAGTHTNNFDCLLLISSTKRSIHFLAKDELWQGPKKIIFANMGLIPVNRRSKDHNAIIQAEKYLKNDCVIGIFPEGTTEKGLGLLPFKKGAVKMASDTDSEIIPFAIIGNYKPFKKGLTIIFGKPYKIKNQDLEYENNILRDKVQELIKVGEDYGEDK